MSAVRVVVADDQTVVRDGLVTLLKLLPGIDVVGARKAGMHPVLMDPYSLHLDDDYDRVASLEELAAIIRG